MIDLLQWLAIAILAVGSIAQHRLLIAMSDHLKTVSDCTEFLLDNRKAK